MISSTASATTTVKLAIVILAVGILIVLDTRMSFSSNTFEITRGQTVPSPINSPPNTPLRQTARSEPTTSSTTPKEDTSRIDDAPPNATLPTIGSLAPGDHHVCLLFDKPHRTASSTVTFALEACWIRQLGLQAPLDKQHKAPSPQSIDWMLDLPSPFVAHYRRHVEISPTQIASLSRRCDNFFYVTTTRSMRGRFRSMAKMILIHNRTSRNATVTVARIEKFKSIIHKTTRAEEVNYERYPFKVIGSSIPPDYVIRYDRFNSDLLQLLRAFGCRPQFETTNVHNIVDESGAAVGNEDSIAFVDDIPLSRGDSRHKRLSEHADKNNEKGITLAKHIAQVIKEKKSTIR